MTKARDSAARIALVGLLALAACTPRTNAPDTTAPDENGLVGLQYGAGPEPPAPGLYSQYVSVPSRAESYSTTFGFLVCSLRPDARITGVRPAATIGTGFEVREIRLATFHPEDGITLASPGYPPRPRPDERLKPIVGSVPRSCFQADLISEVQVGMRKTSDDGGGWRGAVVEYELSGHPLRLEIPYGMLMCGASTDPC